MVAFGSTDLNDPIAGYAKQSQVAVGGLIGKAFGPAILQAYLTTDVYEKNYGGHDTRLWVRLSCRSGPLPLRRRWPRRSTENRVLQSHLQQPRQRGCCIHSDGVI